jgi:hypothetical protein
MRAEQLQLALRPRPMMEAADLGVRMAQEAAGSLRRAWLPLALLLVVACGSTIELAPWLPVTLLWWLKPWLDRALLHVYARQAFGESTSFMQAWEAQRAGSWLQLAAQLTWTRLSAWRVYALPVVQLEGQTGSQRRARLQAIQRGQRGAAWMMQMAFSWFEFLLWCALLSLGAWLWPGLRDPFTLIQSLDGGVLANAVLYVTYAVAVLFVEPFHVAAGFAMYLNRRVELEAWDVEQDLRDAFDHG